MPFLDGLGSFNSYGEASKYAKGAARPQYDCGGSIYAPWFLEANYAWVRGGGGGGDWWTTGATPEWPPSTAPLNGTISCTSVGWVPNVGFVASSPRWPLVLQSLDGLTWSPSGVSMSIGAHSMVSAGNRLYAIESTIRPVVPTNYAPSGGGGIVGTGIPTPRGGVAMYPQLVVATADTFPGFYATEAYFSLPPSMPNGIVSNGKYLFVVDDGQQLSRVPLFPEYDIRASAQPDDPTDVWVGSSNTNQTAELYWTAPADAGTSPISSYVVQSSSDGGSSWTLLPTAPTSLTLTRTITGLTNGTQYLFRVAAVNASGRGPFSVPSAPYIPRPTPPSAPLSVTATPVGPKEDAYIGGAKGSYNVRFRIDWTQSGDGGSPVTGYIIRRFPYELEVGRLTSASTTFTTEPAATVRVFSPGDSVQFEVIAINASGESAPSTPSSPAILR